MCGIAGVLSERRDDNCLDAVEAMTACLRHRGPDDGGIWCDPSGQVVLGHRRLSIIDLTPTGHQPMSSADGRWTVSYNGEIYNHLALRADLERRGSRFEGTCDTEVLVEAIAIWGLDGALSRLNGMFAFAAWDARDERLHLVRDPLGEKPLYYAEHNGRLAFASELGGLGALPWVDRTPDRAATATYLRLGYFPAPYTPFVGVRKLRAGEVVTARAGGRVEPRRYWRLEDMIGQASTDEPHPFDSLESLLLDSVALRLHADVPVGVFLSGGLDSTVVAALAVAAGSGPVRTFTAVFDDPAIDESALAREVAGALGTVHRELPVTVADALDLAPRIPAIYGEPFADPSAIPTALLCRAASEHVKVCLSGDGGDEVFGGYNRYLLGTELWPRLRRFPASARRAAARLVDGIPPTIADRIGDRLPGRLRVSAPGDKLHRFGALLRTRDDAELPKRLVSIWPDAAPIADPGAITILEQPDRWPTALSPTELLMFLDSLTTLPDQMLTKVDRASMASSLEVRPPLLDLRVVQAAWTTPEARLAGGATKPLLRWIAAKRLPSGVLDRPKRGFDPPLGAWLRGPLREWTEALLSPAALEASGLHVSLVGDTWRSFLSGRRLDYRVWSVAMLQAWHLGAR